MARDFAAGPGRRHGGRRWFHRIRVEMTEFGREVDPQNPPLKVYIFLNLKKS